MGTFHNSFHVRRRAPELVYGALPAGALPAYLTRAEAGWVSVYTKAFFDELYPREVSEALACAVVAFHVYDGDVCYGLVYDRGERVARLRVGVGPDEQARGVWSSAAYAPSRRACAARFARLAPHVARGRVPPLFDRHVLGAGDAHVELGSLLGIPPERLHFSYPWRPGGEVPAGVVHAE